ncbi:hypothetical protein [Streptomyces scopuliridis]|uniref:Uncharacterized protein n=1 Tax=Streptomyces scopuliridis TaxID=452529 RepID=A0ACD4ZYS3_9ACTN|nr:hypothetical protein [Streptomyces scopuliridis]WSC03590.1 hypothetical protein OG835_42620 [Streptomyces scopuliridis]
MGFFRETKNDDDMRTYALLEALDASSETGTSESLTEFETVVLFGVAYDQSRPYPPPGHTYPKRG